MTPQVAQQPSSSMDRRVPDPEPEAPLRSTASQGDSGQWVKVPRKGSEEQGSVIQQQAYEVIVEVTEEPQPVRTESRAPSAVTVWKSFGAFR